MQQRIRSVRGKKNPTQIKIAKERIKILFRLAEKELKKHPKRSQRYVELARKIGLRYNVRFSKQLKRRFCKNCNALFKKGVTSETRTSNKVSIIKCLKCNKIYRYPKGK